MVVIEGIHKMDMESLVTNLEYYQKKVIETQENIDNWHPDQLESYTVLLGSLASYQEIVNCYDNEICRRVLIY